MKRAIGVEILEDVVRAVQMVRDRRGLVVEKAVICPMRRSTDQPAAVLDQIVASAGLDTSSPVAMALTAQQVYYRTSPTAEVSLETIPIAADQMIVANYLQSLKGQVIYLAVGTARSSVDGLMKVAGWARVALVDAPAFAIWNAVLANHPGAGEGKVMVCHVTGSYLTIVVAEDGQIIYIRNMPWVNDRSGPGIIRAINATYQRALGRPLSSDVKVYLAGCGMDITSAAKAISAQLGLEAILVDHAAKVLWLDPKADHELLVAEGLAIRCLLPAAKGVNLLAGVKHDQKGSVRKEAHICIALACLLMLGLLAGLLVQRAKLRSDSERLDMQIQSLLRMGLPDQRLAGKATIVAQRLLDQRLQDRTMLLDWQEGRLLPLIFFEQISRSSQGLSGIAIEQIQVDQDRLVIRGICSSPTELDQWCQRLQAIVRVRQVQPGDAEGFLIVADCIGGKDEG